MNNDLLDYFKGDSLAASVWQSKYAQEGEVTPDDMHRRMAKRFAEVEFDTRVMKGPAKYNKSFEHLSSLGQTIEYLTEEEIYNLFKDFGQIVPQGSVMSQLGSKSIGSLSNCFVLGSPEDSYGGIMKLDEEQVQLMKRRGGVGIDISTLRPALTKTSNAAKSSTGAVSFMHRFSSSTNEVAQNGRRGALMLSIDINHPDVMDFIKIKRDLTKVTGANISIKLNDEFMKAVENDEDYILRFPCDHPVRPSWNKIAEEYNKLYKTPQDGNSSFKKIKAKEYWDEIIKSAHNVAEPGLMFWDTMVDYSPDGVYTQFKQVTTNPCSEIAMQPYDACRLILVNLFSFVDHPFTPNAKFNYKKYHEVNYKAMRLADDLVDLEVQHIERILSKIKSDPESDDVKARESKLWHRVLETALASRRTGLGFTALGDTLAALGLKYDSTEGLEIIESIMRTKMKSELDCTTDLAILRGTFKGYKYTTEFDEADEGVFGNNDFYQFILEEFPEEAYRMMRFGRRNVSWSTLAPAGTTSLMTQSTSGVEPLFMPWHTRRVKLNQGDSEDKVDFVDDLGVKWREVAVLHPKFKDWCVYQIEEKTKGITRVEQVEVMSVEELQKMFEKSPWYGSTANDIDWSKRVDIQSTIQKYISHSISSTVNLPNDVTEQEVSDIYLEAWKKKLKGITVYRDGSRSGVLVSDTKSKELTTFNSNHAPKRPKRVDAKLVRFNNNKEKWIAFIGLYDGKPYEVFTGLLDEIKIPFKIEEGFIDKVKNSDHKSYDFIFSDDDEEYKIEGIDKIFNTDYWNYGKLVSGILRHGMPIHFVVDMIGTLQFEDDHINTWKNGVARALKKFIPDGKADGMKCNDCGSTNIIFEEGCSRCLDCGSSKCG